MGSAMRTAIIGGGIAGLAAAYELEQLGAVREVPYPPGPPKARSLFTPNRRVA
jgi:glycine/D-amino acid oxidase-like deaminating enzyme